MDFNTLAIGAAALVGVALLLGAFTWRAGAGWLPALLLALPAAIWLPGFFYSPYWDADVLWAELAGWPLLVIAAAAAFTLRPRLAWFAWDGRNFVASLVLGWLAAALVARGGLQLFRDLPTLLASTATDGLNPGVYRAVILLLVPIMALALWMIGVAAGRLLALPVIALVRRTRGLGFFSAELKFRHRPGDETVEWHYLSKQAPKGWQRRDVPLRHLSSFVDEMRTDRVFERTYQTFEARGRFSGEQISGTIEGPGQWVNRTVVTGKSHLTLGDLAMTVPTSTAVRANRTLGRLFNRYVRALHLADKTKQEEDRRRANAERAAEAERARQREADEAASRQARVEQSRADAHANLQALLADAGLSGSDLWSKYAHDLDGRIVALVAASRAGRGLIVQGDATWAGAWRGASVRIADERLHVQVDDPDWRRQHLSERRFVLGQRWTAEERQTWADRIALLAAGSA